MLPVRRAGVDKVAARTPGTCGSRSSISPCSLAIRAWSYRFSPGLTGTSSRLCVSNPTSTRRRFRTVRRKRPAPKSSTIETATCAMTSDLPSRDRRRLTDRPSFSAAPTFVPDERHAGAIPNTMPVASVSPPTNPITRQSSGVASARFPGSSRRLQYATSVPAAAPIDARSTLSVRSCRISRARVAPSESRIEISRSRAAARDSKRFATFAQTIKRTSATTALSSVTD